MEQFLKEVGAERVSEGAITTLEKELQDTLKDLVEEAELYANYAGRKTVNRSDVELVSTEKIGSRRILFNAVKNGKPHRRKRRNIAGIHIPDASTIPNASSTNPISMSHI